MTDIMVDIETLGTKPGCVILSIGAVAFDRKSFSVLGDMHVVVDQIHQKMMGFTEDQNTVKWWADQDKAAWDQATENPVSVADALGSLSQFYQRWKPDATWTQGNNFDPPILSHLYDMMGQPLPWKFWAVRDTRTFYDILNFNPRVIPRNNTYHNAKDDCLHQIKCMAVAAGAA